MERPLGGILVSRLLGGILELAHSNVEVSSKISAILRLTCKELDQDEAILLTFDGKRRLMCSWANRESELLRALAAYRCQVGEGLIGSVVQKRKAEVYTATELPPRLGCLFYKGIDEVLARYRACAVLPVCDDSFVYGALLLLASRRGVLNREEMLLLSILCRELAGILRHHELMASSKRKMSELATLSEMGKIWSSNVELNEGMRRILLVASRALGASFLRISLGPKSGRYTYGEEPSALQDILASLEAEARRGTTVSWEGEGYLLVSAPLLSREGRYGTILAVLPYEADPPQDAGEMFSAIVSYLASGLENLLLRVRLSEVMAELSEAERTLIEQEKLKGLRDALAYLAHEIRNPLAGIGGLAKRLQKACQMGQKEHRYLGLIVREVERLERTLADVLDYLKDPICCYESCEINSWLDETIYLLSADPSWRSIEVVRNYSRDLPPILCDRRQIRQVFLNIMVNACEAMKGVGTMKVRTRMESVKERTYVAVSFEDTGGGIDPAVIDNIFNPFFTTKENGTGLGLAISNKIVTNHGGMIEIENVPGKGAIFTVYLPLRRAGL
jgi:signal transduction histidine kinase